MDLPAFRITRTDAAVSGDVTVILQVFEEDGVTVCGIRQVTGRVSARPKAWVAAMREELAKIEDEARKAGCQEMRVAGRDWSAILPDYEFCAGLTNGLRKRL